MSYVNSSAQICFLSLVNGSLYLCISQSTQILKSYGAIIQYCKIIEGSHTMILFSMVTDKRSMVRPRQKGIFLFVQALFTPNVYVYDCVHSAMVSAWREFFLGNVLISARRDIENVDAEYEQTFKPCSHITSAFASDVKNGFCENK